MCCTTLLREYCIYVQCTLIGTPMNFCRHLPVDWLLVRKYSLCNIRLVTTLNNVLCSYNATGEGKCTPWFQGHCNHLCYGTLCSLYYVGENCIYIQNSHSVQLVVGCRRWGAMVGCRRWGGHGGMSEVNASTTSQYRSLAPSKNIRPVRRLSCMVIPLSSFPYRHAHQFPRPLQPPLLRYAKKEMQQSSGSTLGVSGIESLRISYHHLLPVVVAANVSAPTSALRTYVRACKSTQNLPVAASGRRIQYIEWNISYLRCLELSPKACRTFWPSSAVGTDVAAFVVTILVGSLVGHEI